MSKKQPRPRIAKAARAAAETRSAPAIEDDERNRGVVDDFVTRNRDALNDSIRKARAEIEAGKHSTKTIAEIIAEGRKRHG